MNVGTFPQPGLIRSPQAFQSPWRRLSSYATGTVYRVEHPFAEVPVAMTVLLRCRPGGAEHGYVAGQLTAHMPGAARAAGIGMMLEPFAVRFIFSAVVGFCVVNAGNSAIVTPANWDVSFLVIA